MAPFVAVSADDSSRPAPAWAADLRELLGAQPVPLDDIVTALRAGHPDVTADEVDDELVEWGSAYESECGWVNLEMLADGTVLTHLLTDLEHEHGVLNGDYDLALWARMASGGLPLATGGEMRATITENQGDLPSARVVLIGPDGWLDGFAPRTMIGLRLRGGSIEIGPAGALPEAGDPRFEKFLETATTIAAAILNTYLSERDKYPGLPPGPSFEYLTAETLVDHPDLFLAPMHPLGLMLELCGFEFVNGSMSLPGVPWDDEADGLSAQAIWARVRVTTFLRAIANETLDGLSCADFFADLADPEALEYAAELAEMEASIDKLTALRAAAVKPRERALAALLSARAAEGEGDSPAAEQLIAEALRDDPDLAPALLDAADYAATRGDLAAAEAHLSRARVPSGHPLRYAVTALLARPAATPDAVGRNHPCPCGSGRTYKVCHLACETRPLPDRAMLAYLRLSTWIDRVSNRGALDFLEDLLDDVARLSADLALFDAGGLQDYLNERGGMLLPDERQLLERWVDATTQPYEVSEVGPGGTVTFRPLLGGDPVTVRDHPTPSVQCHDLFVGRVLHDGERPRVIASMTCVSQARRAELIRVFDDYAPEKLAAFLGPQPSRLANPDVPLSRSELGLA